MGEEREGERVRERERESSDSDQAMADRETKCGGGRQNDPGRGAADGMGIVSVLVFFFNSLALVFFLLLHYR